MQAAPNEPQPENRFAGQSMICMVYAVAMFNVTMVATEPMRIYALNFLWMLPFAIFGCSQVARYHGAQSVCRTLDRIGRFGASLFLFAVCIDVLGNPSRRWLIPVLSVAMALLVDAAWPHVKRMVRPKASRLSE